MPRRSARYWAQARLLLQSVRVRSALAAMAIVAVVLVIAAVGFTTAVERTLVDRLHAQGQERVDAVIDQLAAGTPPGEALDNAVRTMEPSGAADEVLTHVAILDREGHPLFGSGFFTMAGMEEGPAGGVSTHGVPWGEPRVSVGSPDMAVAQRSIEVDGQLLLVVAASPLAAVTRSVEATAQASWWGIPVLVLLAGALTWWTVGRALRPIERIRAEVESLSARNLDRRVTVPGPGDEVSRLAMTMNRMLARLEVASARQREFVSDASHELRSPVATIRTELEVALAHPESGSWTDAATGALEETGRIERIVDDMLLLARLDEGAAPPAKFADVGSAARKAAGRVTGVEIEIASPDGLLARATPDELRSVLGNLVDNAARHATSRVRLTAEPDGEAVVITIDDDGPGIPAADRERVFWRFTRLDDARSRTSGGVGLGLAVVERIVRHRGGSVSIADSPNGGARFVVTLPRRTPTAAE